MSKAMCSQEMAVAKAARTGEWNDSLESHVTGCVNCKEVMQTVRAMRSLAAAPDGESSMPEATRLWCLALLEQRQLEVARARRALVSMELATSALMALGCVGWLAWYWPLLTAQLTAWQTNLWPQLWQAAWFLAGEAPALASRPALWLALLLAAGAILLAQPLLAED
ncbi:MAG: hypothetical protein A3H94_02370 [Acidobacteria bacterium RIFCSPLOWO2_02_FULL_60_20]|nr:MAG: hypothetical protein A3H94_02370 [Acidobacteria bacterium RIFCSPLOWO2_02_FULL_60_20]